MVNIQDLIPRHKSDFDRVRLLNEQPLKSLKPILPELLEWLQDGNWPISKEIEDLVIPFEVELIPCIRNIFNTNDGSWKYFILHGLVNRLPDQALKDLKPDLVRMLDKPTSDEVAEELEEILTELLKRT